MQKIKVCHICGALEGAAWMVEQLRDLRDRHGYDVYALVQKEDCQLAERLREAGIKCFTLKFGYDSVKGMARLPVTIFKIAQLLRRERFDIVQTHLFHSMIVGRIAAWLADVPVSLAMVASPFHLEARITRYIDRATVWMETGVIASCEKTRTLYQEIGVKLRKISLIYYGPDEKKFDPEVVPSANVRGEFGWEADTPVISLVAYFYPELPKSGWVPEVAFNRAIKGHEEFVEAAPIILREFPRAKFLMVGPGWYEEGAGDRYMQKIINRVNELGLEKAIIFTGYRSNVSEILRDVDVAVQAPIIENLGGTVESLLMQRPLVATRVGGIPDAVRDGETGILVEPSNAEDLSRGILQMLQNPPEAERMARNGRRLMLERFSLSRAVDDLHGLYRHSLLKRKRRGYSLWVSLFRLLASVPVYAYLGFRVLFVEFGVRLYSPIYLNIFRYRVKALLYLVYVKAIGALSLARRLPRHLFYKLVGAKHPLRQRASSVLKTGGRQTKRIKD